MEAQKEKFLKGCVEHGKLTQDMAEQLWKLIEPFAAYGFNKAHAASYGQVAYQTSQAGTFAALVIIVNTGVWDRSLDGQRVSASFRTEFAGESRAGFGARK